MTTLPTLFKIKCDKCSRTAEAIGRIRRDLYKKVVKDGWTWKSSNSHLCPDHAVTKVAKLAKKKMVVKKSPVNKKPKKSAPIRFGSIPAPVKSEGNEEAVE